MIDHTLISSATAHAKLAIKNSKSITNDLKLVTDILCPDIVIKLRQFIETVDEKEWITVKDQELFPRRVLRWASDTVLEEVHTVMDNLTDTINVYFHTTDKVFIGLQVWRDCDGYEITAHRDNSIIDIAMQIYLFDHSEKYGTTFDLNQELVNIPFKHNTGYLLYQQKDNKRLVHWSTNKLEGNLPRYSLYLIWGTVGN
jgi:hypothetical protein